LLWLFLLIKLSITVVKLCGGVGLLLGLYFLKIFKKNAKVERLYGAGLINISEFLFLGIFFECNTIFGLLKRKLF